MDKILPQHSFLDSYARMEYGYFVGDCNYYSYPVTNLDYTKKGFKAISEAVKIQPLYTRYWLFLGRSEYAFALEEQNADTKKELIKQADDYIDKAMQLSPKRQEALIEKAKLRMLALDYKNAQDYSEKCIALNPDFGGCYWYLGLAEICLKDNADAEKNIKTASDKGFGISSQERLDELANAFASILDYKDLISVYQQLISKSPNTAQYHSSLAFVYKEAGEYDKARQEALIALQLSPESKPNVDAFLKTLPH
jgi:tetratricopeptide (TPR) repeat protein